MVVESVMDGKGPHLASRLVALMFKTGLFKAVVATNCG